MPTTDLLAPVNAPTPSLVKRSAAKHPRLALPPAMPLLGHNDRALQILGRLRVAIIGCGSVGGRVALNLARLGIGGFELIDPKSHQPSSLATHDIQPADVGVPKAEVAARRCKAIHPALRAKVHVAPIESLDVFALAGVDIFFMSPDLLSAEVATGQIARQLGRPLLHASVHGPTLTLHVRTFLNREPAGCCPACAYGPGEWSMMSRQVRFSCAGAGSSGQPVAQASPEAPATNSVSPLCSAAADLAVLQMLRLVVSLGQPVGDTILEYCGFTHRTIITPIARNPQCPVDHRPLRRAEVPPEAARWSPARWCTHATGLGPADSTLLEVPGFAWVELAQCGCPRPTVIRQYVARASRHHSHTCPNCRTALVPLEFHSYAKASLALLGPAAERPLPDLGLRRIPGLLVHHNDAGWLLQRQTSSLKSPPSPTTT